MSDKSTSSISTSRIPIREVEKYFSFLKFLMDLLHIQWRFFNFCLGGGGVHKHYLLIHTNKVLFIIFNIYYGNC
jgi:hypothetical protein